MRNFSVQVLIRAALLVAAAIALGMIIGIKALVVNQIILALILTGLTIEFLYYVAQVNKRLSRFFEAIRHSDFSATFRDDYLGLSFKHLNNEFSQLIESFRKVTIEKEQQYQLLSLLVESIPIGIVAVRDSGEIILFNSSAGKLLDISTPNNWTIFKRLAGLFTHQVDLMGDGGTQLLELNKGQEVKLLTVSVSTAFDTVSEFRLITIKNIQNEIEQKELEAWHRLIRVLTHEMMNSLTPIASLSETMLSNLNNNQELNNEAVADLRFSLEMIGNRSNRMINFLEEYRRITRVPAPVLEEVYLPNLFEQIKYLTSRELIDEGIELVLKTVKTTVFLDQGQMELVLLNLIKNCRQALINKQNPQITLSAKKQAGKLVILVEDNGIGIEPKVQSQIFVPFFTTKKSGSGIGLSLSRQILRLHRGFIHLVRSSDKGTIFEIGLPIHREAN